MEAGTWALVEVMGHRHYVGQVTETTFAGAPMVRVETPAWRTMPASVALVAPTALFAVTPLTEADARLLLEQSGSYDASPYRPRLTDRSVEDAEEVDPDDTADNEEWPGDPIRDEHGDEYDPDSEHPFHPDSGDDGICAICGESRRNNRHGEPDDIDDYDDYPVDPAVLAALPRFTAVDHGVAESTETPPFEATEPRDYPRPDDEGAL